MEETRHALRRPRRRLRALLLGVPLALVVAVLGAWAWLHTASGQAFIAAKATAALEDLFAGRLTFTSLSLDGRTLHLEALKLYTPEDELVAEVAALTADVSLGALLERRVELHRVRVESPRLYLAHDERGLNLSRALAARHPKPPPTGPTAPLDWKLTLGGLALTDGFFDMQGLGPRTTLSGLAIDGDATLHLGTLAADGQLTARAHATAPLDAPLALEATATSRKGPGAADVNLRLGDSRLRASAEWPGTEWRLAEAVLTPDSVKAFVPAWPLVVPLYAKGSGSDARAVLEVRAGAATVDASARWAASPPALESLVVTVKQVDPAELLGAGKPSTLEGTVRAALPDARVESLTGQATVEATWSAPKVGRLARVSLAASATKGAFTVDTLSAETPGVALSARGSVSPDTLGLKGRLDLSDLSRTARALHDFLGVEAPALAGSGSLEVAVTGPSTHPAVKAVGTLRTLQVASVQAEEIAVDADLPDVTRPVETDILLEARRVVVSGRALEAVRLDFLTRGRHLDVDFTTRGMGDVMLHAVGLLDEDRSGVRLSTFEVHASEAKWSLDAPTHVAWGDALVVQPLTLRDGEQRLTLSGTLRGQRLDARAETRLLDLARLPRILAPDGWGLAGRLSLEATAKGPLSALEAQARLTVADGAAFGITDVAATLEGSWRGRRAKAQGQVHTSVGVVDLDADVSVPALLDGADEPLSATLALRDVDTSTLSAALKRPLPAIGVLSASLSLSGTGPAPVASLTIFAPDLQVPDEAGGAPLVVTRPTVEVSTRDGGALDVKASASAFGGVAQVKVTTPLTLRGLAEKPPDVEALLDTPLAVDVDVRGVDARELVRAELLPLERASGSLGLTGALTGSARRPRGTVTLSAARLRLPQASSLDGVVTVVAEDGRTRLSADVKHRSKPAGTLTAALELPVEALRDLDAVGRAPLTLQGHLLPLDLATLLPAEEGEAGAHGLLSIDAEVTGSLDAPVARVTGDIDAPGFSRASLASARFVVTSTGVGQTLELSLSDASKSALKVTGTTGVDVRLASLRAGLDWEAAPVALTLRGDGFDLGFLSGVTPVVRALEGRLSASGSLSGTLGSPAFVGDASLKRGRLGLAGYGEYRDIDLVVHATNDVFEVSKLHVRAGAGVASVQGTGTRVPGGALKLAGTGSFDKFPIINDDQLLATAGLRVVLAGTWAGNLLNLESLAIPRADIELPDVKRKDLQDLARPKDIIVLRGGRRPGRRGKAPTQTQAQGEASARESTLVVLAALDAPRNLWVRSSDLNIELGLSRDFRLELAPTGTQLSAEATVLRGSLSVIGREFVVQKGSTVRFEGPMKEPAVNVIAQYNNEREKVKVTVTVVGKGTNVQLKTSSDPAMTESEIYTLLATGRRELRRGTGASISPGDAVSVLGQVAAAQLLNGIAKGLPIDVFNFETSDDFQKMKVDVGKYLTDSLYLGVTAQTGADPSRGENPYAARLEWQVTGDWNVEVTGGTAPAGSADVVWARDF